MMIGGNKWHLHSSKASRHEKPSLSCLSAGCYDAYKMGANTWLTKSLSKWKGSLKSLTQKFTQNNPLIQHSQRKLLNWIQCRYPVLNLGPIVVVTGYAPVKEALNQGDVFSVEKVYGERTNRDNGPFVLSLDRDEIQEREKALLEAVMPASDGPKIDALSNDWIEQALLPYREKGYLEVVQEFTRHVPYLFIKEYLGVPGPSERLLKQWVSDIFADIFTNIFNRKALAERGEAAGHALMSYLTDYIDALEKKIAEGYPVPDTVLVRMIRQKNSHQWLNNDTIRRNISGLIVGSLETLNKSTIKVLEALFQRPSIYAHLKSLVKSTETLKTREQQNREQQTGEQPSVAGRSISRSTDIDHLVMIRGYIFELLRFNPHNPFLLRYSKAPFEFQSAELKDKNSQSRSRSRSRLRVGSGKWVILSTFAAQQDPGHLVDPEDIEPLREFEYLHFGDGMHRCQGARVNALLLPKMIRALISLEGLRPLPGAAGALQYTGTFPTQWHCSFAPSQAKVMEPETSERFKMG